MGEIIVQRLEYAPKAYVDYVLLDEKEEGICVFCGVSDRRLRDTTTANETPLIVTKIAEACRANITDLKFFELSTQLNWICKSGEYDYQKVLVNRQGTNI